MFDDLLAANKLYQHSFHDPELTGGAAKELAVVTCIDSRIDPLAILGLHPGDAKIIRNAGARVTDDVLRSLSIAVNLLRVHRVCVVAHTDCAMVGQTDAEMRTQIEALTDADASDWAFLTISDQLETLRSDTMRIRSCPLIPAGVEVGAFVFDVHTGALQRIEED